MMMGRPVESDERIFHLVSGISFADAKPLRQ